ncbi:hypothetical protein ALC62_02484, partial [Cyphomyrmex costatus]
IHFLNIYLTAIQITNYLAAEDEWALLQEFEADIGARDIESQALVYVVSYVAHRFCHKYKHLGTSTKKLPPRDDWISCISRGNCILPSNDFMEAAKIMEAEFQLFHGNFFCMKDKIFDKLTAKVCLKIKYKFPTEVIACLVRTRLYIKLRNINIQIKNTNIRRKERKTKKMCNLVSN